MNRASTVVLTAWSLLGVACGGGGSANSNSSTGQPPPIPNNVQANGADNAIEVTWIGVSGATSYNIYWSEQADVSPTNGTRVSGVRTPARIEGLTNGTTYYVVVTSVNAAGESQPSRSASAVAELQPPELISGLKAIAGDAQITVSWDDQDDADSYTISWGTRISAGGTGGTPNVVSPVTLTGLTNGITYYIRVDPVNAAGTPQFPVVVDAMPRSPVEGWSWQERISDPNDGRISITDVAINDNGLAAVVWTDIFVGNSNVRVSHNAEGDWSEPVTLNNNPDSGLASVAITADGDIVVVYQSSARIMLRRFSGGSWSDELRLDTSPAKFGRGGAIADVDRDNNIVVAWSELDPRPGGAGLQNKDTLQELWVRRFDAIAGAWGDAQAVSISPRDIGLYMLDMNDDGQAVLAWTQDTLQYDSSLSSGGPQRPVAYVSIFDGSDWSTPMTVGPTMLQDEDEAENVSATINSDGTIVVASILNRIPAVGARSYVAEASVLDLQGNLVSGPDTLYDNVDRISGMRTGLDDDGDGVALIFSSFGSLLGMVASQYDASSESWGPFQKTPPASPVRISFPAFGFARQSDGEDIASWSDDGLYVQRSGADTQTWDAAQLIGDVVSRDVRMAVSSNGRIVVASDKDFRHDRETSPVVNVTTYTPPP